MLISRHIRDKYPQKDKPLAESMALADVHWYMGLPLTAENICEIDTGRYSGNARDRRQAKRRAAEYIATRIWLLSKLHRAR